MNDKDIRKISELMDQKLGKFSEAVDQKFDKFSKSVDKKFNAFSQDVDKKLLASEKRQGRLSDRRLVTAEDRITKEIADFIEQNLLPQLDEKVDKKNIEKMANQVDRIERKLDRIIVKDLEQDQRLSKIESLPVVVHDLKIKNSS